MTEVEIIQKFRIELRKRLDLAKQSIPTSIPFRGFGAFDEQEYQDDIQRHAAATASAEARINELESVWNILKIVYGDRLVQLACDDMEERIGELPYIKQ